MPTGQDPILIMFCVLHIKNAQYVVGPADLFEIKCTLVSVVLPSS